MTNPYATAEETASVMRQATPDELWLEAQLERIAPNRFDADVGETDALIKLIFEMRQELFDKSVHKAASKLIALATAQYIVVTIERKPLRPLAMGHASYVIDVRPARSAQ